MTSLSANDLELFSACIEQLYRCQDIDAFPQHVVAVIQQLLAGNFYSYTEVNPIRNRAVAIVEPKKFDVEKLAPTFMRLSHQHPLISHYRRTGDGSAAMISDFMNPRDWHETEIYQQVYQPIDVEDQLSITLPAPPPIVVGVLVSRARRDFTERDRTLFNLFRPHMVAAYELADRYSRLKHDAGTMSDAVESMNVGLVRVTPSGAITFMSVKARHYLSKHLPEPSREDRLPDLLGKWLDKIHATQHANDAAALITPFRIESTDEVLEVRWKRLDDDDLLLIESNPLTPSPTTLQALGLTPREAEVLHWVAEGKTNPEIAIILGMGARTVQKHLERVFAKLNVQTRTAAAMQAIEARRGK